MCGGVARELPCETRRKSSVLEDVKGGKCIDRSALSADAEGDNTLCFGSDECSGYSFWYLSFV